MYTNSNYTISRKCYIFPSENLWCYYKTYESRVTITTRTPIGADLLAYATTLYLPFTQWLKIALYPISDAPVSHLNVSPLIGYTIGYASTGVLDKLVLILSNDSITLPFHITLVFLLSLLLITFSKY